MNGTLLSEASQIHAVHVNSLQTDIRASKYRTFIVYSRNPLYTGSYATKQTNIYDTEKTIQQRNMYHHNFSINNCYDI